MNRFDAIDPDADIVHHLPRAHLHGNHRLDGVKGGCLVEGFIGIGPDRNGPEDARLDPFFLQEPGGRPGQPGRRPIGDKEDLGAFRSLTW